MRKKYIYEIIIKKKKKRKDKRERTPPATSSARDQPPCGTACDKSRAASNSPADLVKQQRAILSTPQPASTTTDRLSTARTPPCVSGQPLANEPFRFRFESSHFE